MADNSWHDTRPPVPQMATGQPNRQPPPITMTASPDMTEDAVSEDLDDAWSRSTRTNAQEAIAELTAKMELIGSNISKIRDELNQDADPLVVPYDLIDEATVRLVWMRATQEQRDQARKDISDSISALGFVVELTMDYDPNDVPF